ncbi:MAG: transcriptional repressor [Pseudomonadota bacterium]
MEFNAHRFLDELGLRATRPRIHAARLLFGDGRDKHVTAEWVGAQLEAINQPVALATVYNTLNNFMEVGRLVQVNGVDRGVIIFDTNTAPHYHIYDETTKSLTDLPADAVDFNGQFQLEDGKRVVGYDFVVRVK